MHITKKILTVLLMALAVMISSMALVAVTPGNNSSAAVYQGGEMMKILFVNGSPNPNGNTAKLAERVLNGKTREVLNLTDYRLNMYGQKLEGDRFEEVLAKMKAADTVIIGSPVYWHNISGSVRILLERFYGRVKQGEFNGKKLVFVFQGAAPEKWMLEAGEYTMKRFAGLYGFTYLGMITNAAEAEELARKLD